MFKFMTADEAITYFENVNSSFSESDSDSDTDNEHEGYASSSAITIILQPPVERPDAVTDGDSDDDDINDINHLPRRILIAEATFKKKALRLTCSAATQ